MPNPFKISFDGASIAGESDGFGLPVVFLHAGVTDRRMWAGQMQAVAAAGFHVISYDRRGFGETESPDEPFSHLADLEAVLDQLSVHAVILVGSSMGGALAIDFALENPARTVGLVLLDTAISGAPPPEDVPDEVGALFDARAYAVERKQWSSVAKIDAHLWLDGGSNEAGRVDGDIRELFIDMDRTALAKPRLSQEEAPEPAIDAVGAITAPVLLIVGELDFEHIVERHEDLSEDLENGFAVSIENTAHFPSLERPDLVEPLLLEFLDAIAGRGEDDED